nr:hypothetical protein [Candidatus Prometheoarchaeum syntrophicum]
MGSIPTIGLFIQGMNQMQMSTHFLIGILTAKILNLLLVTSPIPLKIIVIAVLAVISHYLLDCIAISTYHPYKAHWDDLFFKIFHLLYAYGLSVFIFIWFIEKYWWVMLFSVLPDIIDWYVLRPFFHRDPLIHPSIDKVRDVLFSWLPNLKEKKWAILNEFIIAGSIGIGIVLL